MKLVAIEGSIGTGKSTLLPKLVESLRQLTGNPWQQIQEPVNDPKFLELLNDFTNHPDDAEKRIRFQMYITNRRSEMLKGIDPDGFFVIERSLFSDLVFCQTNMLATERPDGRYISYYYDIKDRLKDYPKVNCLIYLESDPLKSYTRMTERGREEEDGTPFQYFVDLESFHRTCLPQICRHYKTPYMKFNWENFGDPMEVAKAIDYSLAHQSQDPTW